VVGFTLVSVAACALIGVLGQITLPLVGASVQGGAPAPAHWRPTIGALGGVLAAFVVANYAYQAAQPFYNAMLSELAPPEERGRLSGFGTAVGYVGTIAGLLLVFPFFNGGLPLLGDLPPALVHALRAAVPYTAHAGRVSVFVPTALLFLLFALPLFFFCHDHQPAPRGTRVAWREAFEGVVQTLRDTRRYTGTLRFILASFLYQDAIGTIISFMAVYAVEAMGFARGAETTLFLVLTLPAIVGSYALGHVVDRVGPKRTLVVVLASWVALLVAMVSVPTRAGFWVVGFLIGVIFGGVWTAERPLLLSLVPEAEASRFFSLMLLSARAAAVVGPLIWGVTVDSLRPRVGGAIAYRAAVLTVAVMFVLSLLLLRRVPDRRVGRPAPDPPDASGRSTAS
jgi:UMF1 family MFS transporter